MVATTFSTDPPNLVADIVRTTGTVGNWTWWAFLLTGMLTVFLYAKLWRRSGVFTDVEFYELRYSGRLAAVLRGFRAAYLEVVFNVVIMATVTPAAINIGGVMLGLSPVKVVIVAATVTMVYRAMGGLTAVLLTDLIQFTGHGRVRRGRLVRTHPARSGRARRTARARECAVRARLLTLLRDDDVAGDDAGLLFLLRWFWWRINATTELTAMIILSGIAVYF